MHQRINKPKNLVSNVDYVTNILLGYDRGPTVMYYVYDIVKREEETDTIIIAKE